MGQLQPVILVEKGTSSPSDDQDYEAVTGLFSWRGHLFLGLVKPTKKAFRADSHYGCAVLAAAFGPNIRSRKQRSKSKPAGTTGETDQNGQ